MTDYKDSGFDKFLTRQSQGAKTELSEDEVSQRMSRFSGSGLASGISYSSDKKLTINWDKAFLNVSDGARDRVLIGNLEGTGKYGIRIVDNKGNIRLESSDSLQQISMYDDNYDKLVQIDENGLSLIGDSSVKFYTTSGISEFYYGYIGTNSQAMVISSGIPAVSLLISSNGNLTLQLSESSAYLYVKDYLNNNLLIINEATGTITIPNNLTVLGTFTGTVSTANYATTAGSASTADYATLAGGLSGGVTNTLVFPGINTMAFVNGQLISYT